MSDGQGGERGARGPSGADRQRIIDVLCEHYAQDHLEVGEFEHRLDRAHRISRREELEALVSDLPALSRPPAPEPGRSSEVARGSGDQGEPGGEVVVPAGAGRVPASRVPDSQWEFAFWSGRARSGSWIPARSIRAAALMGSVELDFREALFGPGETRIHVVAIMGGVEIIVPPGIHVEADGLALIGAFEEKLGGGGDLADNAPTLRITGFALMGGVEVVSRLPGESPRDARRRLKAESRRRLEGGGRKGR